MKLATDEELSKLAERNETTSRQDNRDIYNLGFEHGRRHSAQECSLWPEPIVCRQPTEADGDCEGFVQCMEGDGLWTYCRWDLQVQEPGPWQHTPRWRPQSPTLKEQALEVVDRIRAADEPWALSDLDIIRRALEAQP